MSDSLSMISALTSAPKRDVAIFKIPKLPDRVKKKPQKILDEEAYVEKMGEIIQRDFFPDLEKMRAQNDYLDAMERNDVVKIRELFAKYSGQKPIERLPSPATFETPQHSTQYGGCTTSVRSNRSTASLNSQQGDKKLTLDQYLNTHTSEDNASFEEMMADAERKHRQKFEYLYNSEEESAEKQEQQLALPPIEQQALTDGQPRPFHVDTWTYKNRNYIMYIPDGVDLTPEEQLANAAKREEIIHTNTRLDKKLFNERQSNETISELAKSKAKVLDGKIGVDGKEIVQGPGPRINGYGFVTTPSPMAVAQSPLMTWGAIEGTPFRLDGSDTPLPPRSPGPAFKMAEPPRREQLAMALAEKASERHRDKKRKAIDAAKRQFANSSPSPRPSTGSSTIERLSAMSPAARQLAVGRLRLGTSSVTSPALGSRTSPRPSPGGRNSKPSPRIGAYGTRAHTPKLDLGIKRATDDTLTDDLLKINVPKRKTAADFF